jgi:hypothetical protein
MVIMMATLRDDEDEVNMQPYEAQDKGINRVLYYGDQDTWRV